MTVINTNTSNYILTTSDLLKEYTDNEIANTSNYILNTSNITSDHLSKNLNDTSNYIGDTSNMFIDRIKNTSNYILNTFNYAATNIKRINEAWNDKATQEAVDNDLGASSALDNLVSFLVELPQYTMRLLQWQQLVHLV